MEKIEIENTTTVVWRLGAEQSNRSDRKRSYSIHKAPWGLMRGARCQVANNAPMARTGDAR